MSRSECYCRNYSCESNIKQGNRFRFEKEDNVICGGSIVDGTIENCPIRQSGEFKLKPYTAEQLGEVACKVLIEKPKKKKR